MNTTQQLEKSMARQERLYALYCFLSLVKEGAPNLAGAPPAANEAMFLLANRITGMESPELDRVTAGKSLDEWVEDFERDMPKSPFEEEEVVFGPKDMASPELCRYQKGHCHREPKMGICACRFHREKLQSSTRTARVAREIRSANSMGRGEV